MSRQATPSITKDEFDAIAVKLQAELRTWYDDESEMPPAQAASTPTTQGAWDGMPEIDSKAVVKASRIFRKYLGIDLDPKMIRRGGYASFDDLIHDLFPKLREACPVGAAVGATRATVSVHQEARCE